MKSLAYNFYSSQGALKQIPLVILHGLFGQAKNWHRIAKLMTDKYDIYVPDLPNHGKSYHCEDLNYELLSHSILKFLDEHHLKKVNLVAHSMGGKATMLFALNYPQYINKLIVVDIAPISYQHDFSNILDALDSVPLDLIKSRGQAEQILAESISDQRISQFLISNLEKKDKLFQWQFNLAAIKKNIASIIAFPEVSAMQYEQLCWFLAGNDSDYIQKSDTLVIKKLFPKAKIIRLKNAGHWLHVEQPDAFMQTIRTILN